MTRRLNFWLLVLILIFAGSFFLGRERIYRLILVGHSQPQPQTFVGDPARKPIHLLILNGTGQAGLAREFSLLVARAGCVCEGVGNAPRTPVNASFLVNRRLTDDLADDLARMLGGLSVNREWDSRTTEDAVLVLGLDFAKCKEQLHSLTTR